MPHAGKPEEIAGEAAKFYFTGTDEYTKYLVTVFNQYNSIQGCNIFMDRHFYTMRHDRKGIPNELKAMTDRDDEIILVSYIDKKKSCEKNTIALKTMHNQVKMTNYQWCKPYVLVIYDQTKGGVDEVDLISTHHSTKIISKRWPLNAFAFILDTVRTNAKTVLADNKSSFSNFEFTYQLAKALVLPVVQRRYEIRNGIQIAVMEKITRVLGVAELNRQPQPESPPTLSSCCYKCVEMIVGKANYKLSWEKINSKLKSKC